MHSLFTSKAWQDLKSRTKTKISSNLKSRNETGGGECCLEFVSVTDKEVLSIIKDVSVVGHKLSAESRVDAITVPQTDNFFENKIQFLEEEGGEEIEKQTAQGLQQITDNTYTETVNTNISHTLSDDDTPSTSNKASSNKATKLSNSAAAASSMQKYMDDKVKIKKQYYENKIRILEELSSTKKAKADAVERVATALENLAEAVGSIAENLT